LPAADGVAAMAAVPVSMGVMMSGPVAMGSLEVRSSPFDIARGDVSDSRTSKLDVRE
jgi:hypothetical protein